MASSTTITEFSHLQIPLAEILEATNNFSNKNIIGKGDFGNVYKGRLMRDGKLVKISARRLDRKCGLGDVEFWTEISVLSSFQHRSNIVRIIGFCDEKGEKIIINEHYAKGSLLTYLSNPSLTWDQRLWISNEVAHAIGDIHDMEEKNYYVIHRNINSSTILLDSDWKSKLSGFEFSIKQSSGRRNEVFYCEAIGTKGYIDPTIEKNGGVMDKSDVYSFGVVLFEILCGRKANGENGLLAPLAKFHFEKGTLQDIIHADLWNQMDPKSLECFSKVAYSCLEEDPSKRPDMKQVGDQLVIAWRHQNPEIYSKQLEHRILEAEKDRVYQARRTYLDEKDKKDENDKEDKKDNLQDPETVSVKSTVETELSDHWKLKKWEHLRIEGIKVHLPSTSQRRLFRDKDQGCVLFNVNIECSNNEYLSSIDGKNKFELPTRNYNVTVKRIENKVDRLLTELGILSICRHPNIETLLGFYEVNSIISIFYKFVSLKYLYGCLSDGNLTWGKRLKICIDVANGLNYLHNEMEDQKTIIHRDINSKNIELDSLSRATIVGFHNSVFLPPNQDDNALHIDEITGDIYYMDPEYAETGKLKRESDIFSFGIVMLEILFGKCATDIIKNEGCEDRGLAPLARRWFNEGTIKEKLALSIKQETYGNNCFLSKGPNEDSLDTFLRITYQCLAETHNKRPRMEVVVNELQKASSFQENHKDPFRMSLEDIKLATQNFSPTNKVGGGGFGSVYKGKIAHGHDNGHNTIVAKKLDTRHGQGEKQFYNEIRILYEYRHENIIGLVGYINETDEKLVVYEHASKGSLDKNLSNDSLTWRNRIKICIDVVTGLDFLHGGIRGKEVIIHRDIKTANILLFDDWKAKIGDFGLSLISTINKETKFTVHHACGTMDYVDPLYLKSGLLTIESDIYSLGVVLFEILYGRVIYTIPRHASWSLLGFIKHNVEEGKKEEMVFKGIKEEIMQESLDTFLNIVYKCLDDNREKRPTSKEVLAQLKKALEFQDDTKTQEQEFKLVANSCNQNECLPSW